MRYLDGWGVPFSSSSSAADYVYTESLFTPAGWKRRRRKRQTFPEEKK